MAYALALLLSIGNLVGPFALGRAVTIHPVEVIFGFVIDAMLFGIIGLVPQQSEWRAAQCQHGGGGLQYALDIPFAVQSRRPVVDLVRMQTDDRSRLLVGVWPIAIADPGLSCLPARWSGGTVTGIRCPSPPRSAPDRPPR